jgi:membrane protein
MAAADRSPARAGPGLVPALSAAFETGRLPAGSPLPAWLGPIFAIIRSFLDTRGILQASALSYTTVLSIVPFLAVAFSVAKGLGLYNSPQVRGILLRLFAGREDVADQILLYIQNTNLQTLGAVGTILLLFTAVSLLFNIEVAVNAAWGMAPKATVWSRFTNYFVFIVLCPPLLFAALSVTASLQALDVTHRLLEISFISGAEKILLTIAPVLTIWVVFYLLYQFLPNTRVKPASALLGAVTAGTVWQVVQWAYLKFQFGSASYNAIYGSFAQIPLLLVWLYVSWVIVLLGAQISHTSQCYRQFLREDRARRLTQAQRHGLALFLALLAARAAAARRLPPPVPRLAGLFGLPEPVLAGLWEDLATAGLVVEAASPDGRAFTPLARPEDVTVAEVARALDTRRDGHAPPALAEAFPKFAPLFEAADASDRQATLAGLLDRFGPDLDAVLADSA